MVERGLVGPSPASSADRHPPVRFWGVILIKLRSDVRRFG
jgi:hypothetical protein